MRIHRSAGCGGVWGVQALGFCKETREDLICKRYCLNKVVIHKCSFIGNESFFSLPLVSLSRRSRQRPVEEILLSLFRLPLLSPPVPGCLLWTAEAMPIVSASTGTARHKLRLLGGYLWSFIVCCHNCCYSLDRRAAWDSGPAHLPASSRCEP